MLARRDFGSDFNRLAGGEESVHPGGGDADTLLSSAHAEAVKFGAVEKFSEDEGYRCLPTGLSGHCSPLILP